MRVLGIDTGFAIVGWSIVEKDPMQKNGLKLVEYGAVVTESTLDMPKRLQEVYNKLDEIIKYYKPDAMAIESLFYFKNQKTVMTVSQARGVILLVAENNHLESFSYTPLQVKTTLTGYGRAEKKQIQKILKMMFSLDEVPKPDDAADAIAIAVCHVHNEFSQKLKR